METLEKGQILNGRFSGEVGREPRHRIEHEEEVDKIPDFPRNFLAHRENTAQSQNLARVNDTHHVSRLRGWHQILQDQFVDDSDKELRDRYWFLKKIVNVIQKLD